MSDKATNGNGHAAWPIADFPFAGFPVNAWGAAFTLNAECNAALHEGFAAFSREWQDFVSARMKEDLTLVQRVGAAKSPEQVWTAYATFWQKAVEDYWKEYGRAAKLAGGLMNRSMTAVQRQMEEATESATKVPSLEKAA